MKIIEIRKLTIEWKKKLTGGVLVIVVMFACWLVKETKAQTFQNFPWSVIDSQLQDKTTQNFLKNVTKEDIEKMAYLIGQIEPYDERNHLNRLDEKDYKFAKGLMRQSAEKLMSEREQDNLRRIQKQGIAQTVKDVNVGGWGITVPGIVELNKLIERISTPQYKVETIKDERGTYTGETINGEPDGRGVMKFKDGGVYTGRWTDGNPHGRGVSTHPDGSRYEGDWDKGWVHGHGTLLTRKGDTYVGKFINGLYDGEGTLTYKNGKVETGIWKAGKLVTALEAEAPIKTPPPAKVGPNGREIGTFSASGLGGEYTGELDEKGWPLGQGTFVSSFFVVYIGTWKGDVGKVTMISGSTKETGTYEFFKGFTPDKKQATQLK